MKFFIASISSSTNIQLLHSTDGAIYKCRSTNLLMQTLEVEVETLCTDVEVEAMLYA